MIARTWRGATRAADADAYLEYLRKTGLREYRATPGNHGVLGLRSVDGERAELLLVSLWESEEAIRAFAGDEPRRAIFYPEDDRFLTDRDEHVDHFEVVHQEGVRIDGAAGRGAREMHRAPLTDIAPEIFRKRLLVEGFFTREITHEVLEEYFAHVAGDLGLRTYGDPIIHRTSGEGREVNEGFDGFVPLVDSGIYVAAWVNPRFLSTIVYTCGQFDEERAVELVRDFFGLDELQAALF